MPLYKRCYINNCFRRAFYGFFNETNDSVKITRCKIHKETNMYNFSVCHNCLMSSRNRNINKKNNYCSACYVYLNPNSKYAKTYKKKVLKQDYINDLLIELSPFEWDSCDKIIEGSCCLKRPDYFKDFFTHTLLFEIDEDQHKHKKYSKETERLKQLYYGLGKRKMVVIRFNPDKYINKNGKIIKSIFSNTPIDGELKMNENKCRERLHNLKDILNYVMDYENLLTLLNDNNKKEVLLVKICFDERHIVNFEDI
jgi:hypothetical protein